MHAARDESQPSFRDHVSTLTDHVAQHAKAASLTQSPERLDEVLPTPARTLNKSQRDSQSLDTFVNHARRTEPTPGNTNQTHITNRGQMASPDVTTPLQRQIHNLLSLLQYKDEQLEEARQQVVQVTNDQRAKEGSY